MTVVSVVVPTIAGREDLLAQTKAAYQAQDVPLQLIVARDHPTIGEAWNAGAEHATGDYLHLTADDVLPAPGALTAALSLVDEGFYPSPLITRPDGSVEACGSMGGGMLLPDCPTGTPCVTSPFPLFRREHWAPDCCLPIQYYADDWLAHLARQAGLRPIVCREYQLTHLEGTVGRDRHVGRAAMFHCQVFLAAVAKGAAA